LIVARFLALLEIYRDGLVTFDQPTPLGELFVRWNGDDETDIEALGKIDEFDTTEVEEFRNQLDANQDRTDSEQMGDNTDD
jgi:segregation and condensation protein A